jgi:uncharacterized protein Yka (UPF0111/DUF47 family)
MAFLEDVKEQIKNLSESEQKEMLALAKEIDSLEDEVD